MPKKIIIFSDNHDYNRDMLRIIKKVEHDYTVNCGDHFFREEEVKNIFDFYVDGNNDHGKKEIEIFELEKTKFLITHGHKQWSPNMKTWINNLRALGKSKRCDVVIFGHSHVKMIDDSEKPYVVNPGSISLPRKNDKIGSYLLIEIKKEKIEFIFKSIE